jgi:serine/threonine-protein kinase
MRFGRIFYIIVLLICIFEVMRLWSIMPPEMAAHFNVQGNPDRFVPKPEFFGYQIQTLLIVVLVSIPLQLLFLVLPVDLINMPQREYWLAPERRAETVGRLSDFAAMLFGLILLTIQAGFELSAYANLQTPIHFNAQWMLVFMAASFVVIGLMLFQLTVSFRRPASNGQTISSR